MKMFTKEKTLQGGVASQDHELRALVFLMIREYKIDMVMNGAQKGQQRHLSQGMTEGQNPRRHALEVSQ